jgi:hypothetical protein
MRAPSLADLQALLGHSSIATSERDTPAVDDDEIRAAMIAAIADT